MHSKIIVSLLFSVMVVLCTDKAESQELITQKANDENLLLGKKFKNSIGMEFVFIPKGNFIMGSPETEKGRDKYERQHEVILTKHFYMQTTEVTQGQWIKVMGSNPSFFQNCGNDCPVEQVSQLDCIEFIRKLNELEGTDNYRLPTEAEWEYACRAGSKTSVYSGDLSIISDNRASELDKIAWYAWNSCVAYANGQPCSNGRLNNNCSQCGTHPVMLKEPNAWGLYDMIGNVWEWCQDFYKRYSSEQVTNPLNKSVAFALVVNRGGGWKDKVTECRSATRNRLSESKRYNDTGFRVVRSF